MSPSLMPTLSFFLRSTSTRSITTTMTSMIATRSPITAPTTAPVLSLLLPRSVVSVGDEDTGDCEVGSVVVLVVVGGDCVAVGESVDRIEVGESVLLTTEGTIDPRGTEEANYYRGIYTGNKAIDLRIFKVISGRPSIKSPDDIFMPPTDP